MAHVTFPKPERNSFKRERHERRSAETAYELREKAKVRARDNFRCRWPVCRTPAWEGLEVAHLRSKSVGGESDADAMMLLCVSHHRGSVSLHSGDLRVVPIYEDLGSEGPCRFQQQNESGEWADVACERSVCISETRGA